MALDSRVFFASIVSFLFRRIGVFNALRVHYAEACFLFPTIVGTNLSDHFFLMPDRVCSLFLLPLRSRFQSRSGRFSISGSHLAAFSIGNRSSTHRVLHNIHHRDPAFSVSSSSWLSQEAVALVPFNSNESSE